MDRGLKTAFVALILAGISLNVNATTIIYDNGVTYTDSHTVSQPSADQVVADDFLLTSRTTISSIEWIGAYSGQVKTAADDFTILLHTDLSGSPVADALYAFDIGSAVIRSQITPDYVFSYSADISVTLDAGIYWLSIYSNRPDPLPKNRWVWIHEFKIGENSHYRNTIGADYLLSIPYKTDFRLFGTVPEPSAFWLFWIGLAGIGYKRRQSMKA